MDWQRVDISSLRDTVRAIWQDDSGVTAIEYGLLAALLALAVYTTLGPLAEVLLSMYAQYIAPALQAVLDAL